MDDLVKEIEMLRAENQRLVEANDELRSDNIILQQRVNELIDENPKLQKSRPRPYEHPLRRKMGPFEQKMQAIEPEPYDYKRVIWGESKFGIKSLKGLVPEGVE